MEQRLYRAASVGVFLAMASAAHATVGCAVVSSMDGAESVGLHNRPEDASDIIREVPLGDIVQFVDQDLAPEQADGWVWVRHDISQEAIWQTGIFGWMRAENIADCG